MAKKTFVKKLPQRKKMPQASLKIPRRNVLDLKDRMIKIRRELTGIGAANGKANLFRSTVEQLDALADEITDATDQVMMAGEAIQKAADRIGAKTEDSDIESQLNKISANTDDLFEACSVQDITGQRITKITRTVDAIEAGFVSVIQLAGGKGAKGGNRAKGGKAKAIDRIDGGLVLEGPQVGGPAVKQVDIDKHFD